MRRTFDLGRIALLACMWPSLASALSPDKSFHQYARDTWSVEHGLPQNSAHAIAQDGKGYIWIGTQRGLTRFDGVSFRAFEPDDTPALPSRWVHSLLRDRSDALWIGTDQGIARFEDGRFHTVTLTNDAADRERIRAQVWRLVESPGHGIVAATHVGLFRQRSRSVFGPWDIAGTGEVRALASGADAVWAAPIGEVIRIPHDGGEVTRHAMPDAARSAYVSVLLEHGRDLWIGSRAGLYRLADGRVHRVPLAVTLGASGVTSLHVDADQNLWVGTESALLRLRDGGLTETVHESAIPALSNIISMMEDHEGSLWLGSYHGGLSRVWNGWVQRYSRPEGLDDTVAWVVTPWSQGRILVGVRSGVRVLEGGRFHRPPYFAPIDGHSVAAFLPDGDALWIGTSDGLFRHLDGRSVKLFAEELRGVRVRHIRRLQDGRLGLATSAGFFSIEGDVLSAPAVLPSGFKPFLRALAQDEEGRIYVGGPQGVFEVRDGDLHPLDLAPDRPPATHVILALGGGGLLIGGSGDALWWRDRDVWRELSPAVGIVPNNTSSFLLDRAGWIWASGSLGVSRMPLSDLDAYAAGRIRKVHAQMVLSIGGEVTGTQKTACCNSSGGQSAALIDGALWYPTSDGVIRLPTNAVTPNTVIPDAWIERIRWSGRWHDVDVGARLALPPDARDVDVDFTALSYRDPKSVALKYQLVGYDPDWRTPDNALHRRATYTNLAPGAYLFRVIAANDVGVWNERPAELHLTIAPRFGETLHFRLLLALGLVGLAYIAMRLRTAVLRRDRDRLDALVRERTAALEAANRALHEASETDPLTGLHNRRYFLSHLAADLTRLRLRLAGGAVSSGHGFVLADIDHFKSINDRHGHDAGDVVLCHVARILRAHSRDEDDVIRWGGEEFLLLVRNVTPDALAAQVKRLRQAVAESSADVGNGVAVRATASFGFVAYPLLPFAPDTLSWQHHVELADMALYHAKQAGRNTWACWRASREAHALLTEVLAAGPVADLVTAGVVELALDPRRDK